MVHKYLIISDLCDSLGFSGRMCIVLGKASLARKNHTCEKRRAYCGLVS